MKLSTRELATIAVFGTLWGLVEISLGTVLKSLNVPLSGVVLSTIGLIVALVGRLFVPRRGSTLFVGLMAMLLKLFSLGGVILGPMVGILSEALVAEVVLSALGRPRRLSLLAAGAAGVLCPLVQPFVTNPLLFGRTLFTVWLDLLDLGSRLFGFDAGAVVGIVLALVGVHLAIGIAAGWLAWDVGRRLQVRLGTGQFEATQV
jgi:ABC-type thiamin/hydroxymethylpyrimidine transport system permease subunit